MATVDSGIETLFSDDSPCDLVGSPSACSGYDTEIHAADLHQQQENIGPPNIQPYSGVLEKGKEVIRPIAFKPTLLTSAPRFGLSGERYGSTPVLTRPGSRLTLYGSSSDLRHIPAGGNIHYSLDRKLRSSCPSATSSSPHMQMTSLTSLPHKLINYDSLESVRKSPVSSVMDSQMMMMNKSSSFRLSSGGCGSLLDLTPSPSDSGVSELEAALRDRDSELAYLRQTMEHNEQVIFRVYQEKERVWERELRRLKNVHENRLRANAQKTLKLEQMLMTQTYQLQQDKKRLLAETQRATCQSERLRQEVCTLRGRLEETEWALCQKTGEISLLKSQLKDYQHEQTLKGHEFLQLKTDHRELRVALEMKEEEIETLQKISLEKDDEIASFKAQLKTCFQDESDEEEEEEEEDELDESPNENNFKDNVKDNVNDNLEDNFKDNFQDNLKDNLKLKEEKLRLKEEIRELRKELSEVSMSEYHGLEAGRNLRSKRIGDQVEDFQDFNKEMDLLRNELEERKKDFEKERVIWAQEKEKVLRYQRQLQMNYVQMYRRTRALEDEVEALTIELELDKTGHKKKISSTTDLTQTIEL